MKATTTLGNLIEQVETMSAGNFDETVSLNEIEFGSLNEMWIGGVGVEVLPQAQRLLANRLRTPFSYLERCPAELQAENLNYWLEQERKERNTFFCRFNGQRQVRAVFTDRYTAIDNTEILSKMLELNFRPEQEVQYMLDDGMMVVKVPEYAKSFEVALKDAVVPGISIGNSEIGFLSFCIECFYLRLVCANGMVAPVSVGQSRFKHISRKAFEALPETIRQVAESSNRQQAQMVDFRQHAGPQSDPDHRELQQALRSDPGGGGDGEGFIRPGDGRDNVERHPGIHGLGKSAGTDR